MLLSTQAGSGLTPVGGIIVWPKDSDPSTSSNIWLECNGQTYDTSRFPKLYKVLGSNKTPNFQGMFLRGAGSQSYSQVNGVALRRENDYTIWTNGQATSTIHKSNSIGSIQGDSIRDMNWCNFTTLMDVGDKRGFGEYLGNAGNVENWLRKDNDGYSGSVQGICYGGAETSVYFPLGPISIHVTETNSSGSGENASTTTTSYDVEVPTYKMDIMAAIPRWNAKWITPVDNEIRPVNIAVKYYIRAK